MGRSAEGMSAVVKNMKASAIRSRKMVSEQNITQGKRFETPVTNGCEAADLIARIVESESLCR